MAVNNTTLALTGTAFVDSYYPDRNISGQSSYDFSSDSDRYQRLYLKFESPPASIAKYALISAFCVFRGSGAYFAMLAPTRDFSTATITYNTRTGGKYVGSKNWIGSGEYKLPYWSSVPASEVSEASQKILKYNAAYVVKDSTYAGQITSISGLTVAYDDEVTVLSKAEANNCITEGYLNPHETQTFSWNLVPLGGYHRVSPATQLSATLNWRTGTSGSWTTISPTSDSDQYITVPADTFPASSTFQWMVNVIDDTGYLSSIGPYTISTADSEATATPVSPTGQVEDGSGPITFAWNVTNESGTTHTASQLQIYSGNTLKASPTISSSETTYSLAANSLDAGANKWRVRAANSDGTYGSWSDYAEFIVVAAPGTPTVTVTGAAWGSLKWQSSGQQAYRITLNGERYGPYFGTEKTWSWPTPLPWGTYVTATVEIQGVYGLWSQPGSVSWNTGASTTGYINVTGRFGTDAELSWTDRASASSINLPYYVWRDGELIGKTNDMRFTDRFVLGQHSYYVSRRRNDNRTAVSNTVTDTLKSCTTRIAPFEGGSWLDLKLNEEGYGLQTFGWTRTASVRHVSGAAYPVLELSPYEDETGSYSVAFKSVEDARQLEAMKGRLVILKSRGGNVIIGALTSLQKSMRDFYLSYQFSIQRVHWEDFIDDTDG